MAHLPRIIAAQVSKCTLSMEKGKRCHWKFPHMAQQERVALLPFAHILSSADLHKVSKPLRGTPKHGKWNMGYFRGGG